MKRAAQLATQRAALIKRQLDLIAALALVIVIVAACRFVSGGHEPPSQAAFIVPSQSVHW